jgi:hypothetical protein
MRHDPDWDYFPDLGFAVTSGWCGVYMSHYQCDHICKTKNTAVSGGVWFFSLFSFIATAA